MNGSFKVQLKGLEGFVLFLTHDAPENMCAVITVSNVDH